MSDKPGRIVARDPAVLHGKPHIRGTRILVGVIVDDYEAGRTVAEIANDYPPLTPEQVIEVLRWAGIELPDVPNEKETK